MTIATRETQGGDAAVRGRLCRDIVAALKRYNAAMPQQRKLSALEIQRVTDRIVDMLDRSGGALTTAELPDNSLSSQPTQVAKGRARLKQVLGGAGRILQGPAACPPAKPRARSPTVPSSLGFARSDGKGQNDDTEKDRV